MWPTPRAAPACVSQTMETTRRIVARDGYKGRLEEAVATKMWPTPKARDWKGQSQRGIHAPMDALPNMDNGHGRPIGGQLNPPFVEWLMGYPIGWTDLNHSEMP